MVNKKDRILQSAGKVLFTQGPNHVSMSRVANEAAIGKSTIYEYFDSKEDLMCQTILYVIKVYIDKIRGMLDEYEDTFDVRLKKSIEIILESISGEMGGIAKMFHHNEFVMFPEYLKEKYKNEFLAFQKQMIDYTKEFMLKYYNERQIDVEIKDIDAICFQRCLATYCATLSGKDIFAEFCLDDVDDKVTYIYEHLIRML